MDFETLLYSVNNGISTITFNRPKAFNSFDKTMADELEFITSKVFLDKNIRAVCLNGSNGVFMVGGDLHYFHSQFEHMPLGVLKIVRTLNASILNLMSMPKPVIACVEGSVAGAGMSVMMACDLVIAEEKTKFTMAYNGIGITPDGGASFNLPRLVGIKKAMQWTLLSEMITAQEALDSNLINWVFPQEKLKAETDKVLMRLAKGPTKAFALTKKLMNMSYQHSLETQLEEEGRAFEACSDTKDFKSGVSSFLSKVKAEFSGS